MADDSFKQSVFHKRDSIVSRTVDGNTLLIDINRSLRDEDLGYCVLTGVGDRIWELLDGRHTLERIAGILVEEYDVTREIAEEDLKSFLDELIQRNFVLRTDSKAPGTG
ncbi:PqqD family peptide modification chaperone [bacterium]|nr:PqqD family peptide modification chaperone [bacterium]